MEQYVKLAFDYSPALMAGVIATILVTVVLLKTLGFTAIGDKSKLVDDGKLSAVTTGITGITSKLTEMEKRIGTVENDISNRPTREEMHRLELSFTRLEGEVRSSNMTIQSTATAINRIEDYMYAQAAGAAGRRTQGAG